MNIRSKYFYPECIINNKLARTLPFGTPDDIKTEFKYLIENHGDAALTPGASSSVTPGVSIANIDALTQGLKYYRTHLV